MISPLGIRNYIPRVTKSSRFLIDVLSAILIDTRLICQAAVGARQTPKEERAGVVNRLQRVGGNVSVATLTIRAVYCIGVSPLSQRNEKSQIFVPRGRRSYSTMSPSSPLRVIGDTVPAGRESAKRSCLQIRAPRNLFKSWRWWGRS